MTEDEKNKLKLYKWLGGILGAIVLGAWGAYATAAPDPNWPGAYPPFYLGMIFGGVAGMLIGWLLGWLIGPLLLR